MELTILSLILAVQTIVIVVGVILLARTSKRVQNSTDQLNELVYTVRPKIDEIFDGINDFVKTTKPVGEQLVNISIDLKEMVESAKDSTHDVSDLIKDTSATARRQVSKIDNVLTDTVKKMEVISTAVMDNLLSPLSEIAAVLKGVRVALGYLKGDRPRRSYRDVDEEDMII